MEFIPKIYDIKTGYLGLDPKTGRYIMFPTEDEYYEYLKELEEETDE